MKAGFGQADITPRPGVQLAGYGPYRNRAARSVLAPLAARALVLTEGRRRAVVLSLELCCTHRPLAARLRAAVARRIGCQPAEVFVSSTHTHSGPATGGMYAWGEPDMLYVETLLARAADAAEHAQTALQEVTWRYAEAPCEGIAVNRETDAGFAREADFASRLRPDWRPAHPEQTDPVVRVLGAYAGEKLVGFLHHFGCHPVVCGEDTCWVHGDYAGLASLALEKKHPGAVAIYLPGAHGDINPKLNHRNPRESRRAVQAIARQYTGCVTQALKRLREVETPASGSHLLAIRSYDVVCARQKWTRAYVQRRIAELENFFATPGITDRPEPGGEKNWLQSNGTQMTRLQGLRALLADFRGARAPNPPVHLSGLRIGPVALLGCGLEVYHSLQAPVLAGSPHRHTWVVSLVGGFGYAPDLAALQRAGYTGDFVPLMTGEVPYARLHEEIPAALVKLARSLA